MTTIPDSPPSDAVAIEGEFTLQPPPPGDITFFRQDENHKQIEVLRLCADGSILVRGKLVENDKEVVEGMRDFLAGMRGLPSHD